MTTLFSSLLSYAIGLAILGFIVFVHEMGHFLVARAFGIGVEIFSVGFGPEMIGWTKKNTRYRISWIPFGGYCKLKGELQQTTPDSLYGKPAWIRILVLVAGPLANLLLALLVMVLLYTVGYEEILPSRHVDIVESIDNKPSPAYEAGLRPGSEILSINGIPILSFQDIVENVALNANSPLSIVFVLSNTTNTTSVLPRLAESTGTGEIGVFPVYFPIIGAVLSNSPAQQAQLQPNDRIIGVDEKPITYYYEFREAIRNKGNMTVTLSILRGNSTNRVSIKLEKKENRGFLGISISGLSLSITNRVRASSLSDAIKQGSRDLIKQLSLTIKGFARMFQGNLGVSQNLYGPIRIVRDTALVTSWGDFALLMRFIALISLGLGLANLIPIPGLDGGHILINGVEGILRRKIPDHLRIAIENIGILFLLVLAAWILSNDITNIITRR
jgi:regulator of sigma E protease